MDAAARGRGGGAQEQARVRGGVRIQPCDGPGEELAEVQAAAGDVAASYHTLSERLKIIRLSLLATLA